MRLEHALVRLPLRFDPAELAAEVACFGDDEWLVHPTGYLGSSSIVLVTAHGSINDDFAIAGPMRATPHLARCEHLRAVLASLDVPISRTRLMRLHPGQSVPEHVDDNYHWWRRLRIHVPIVTDPSITFSCGGLRVHMAAGECWTFDNERPHRVDNPSAIDRIHLVVDTLGSPSLWQKIAAADSGAPPVDVALAPGARPSALPFEPYRFAVLEPSELEGLTETIWRELQVLHTTTSMRTALRGHLDRLLARWQAAFERHGHDRSGELEYAGVIAALADELPRGLWCGLEPGGAAASALAVINTVLQVSNRSAPLQSVSAAQGREAAATAPLASPSARYQASARGAEHLAHHAMGCPARLPTEPAGRNLSAELERFAHEPEAPASSSKRGALDHLLAEGLLKRAWEVLPTFDRPVFIVSAPRSGSTMLFELLTRCPPLWSLGRESDDVFAAVAPASSGSDALGAEHATPELERALRHRLLTELVDGRGARLCALPPDELPRSLRLLEKTPRNALRLPLLAALWPDARFVYLHRDPASSVASIMEAWRSGGFVTRARLPGWTARRWSLLLPPQWEPLDGRPLAEVAAFQWAATNAAIMDALASIDAHRWTTIEYEQLVARPRTTLQMLCDFAEIPTPLDAPTANRDLPLSRHTVSAPAPDKWAREREAIEPLLPGLQSIQARIHAFTASVRR
ncbi:sulfotransferase [Paraliomyxa miuraensis]|uniref:sulfotransferase n=1 Tax=Paraliomyxa miuraensis TaxID=376150 RepID=UPI00225871F8|nr:sulfotransferase [Paraliomyxa miuraensis]MCX4242645.1 sulfotransferase [Paraliomyxa miuraensis]